MIKISCMKIKFTYLMPGVLFFCIALNSNGYSQHNYIFENISTLEGLSSSEVQKIFQDNNGFLWISTSNGLNRYDGYNMTVFKNDPNDSLSLPNNYCGAITEDSDGFLWIGTLGNIIARYDPKSETFKSYAVDSRIITTLSESYSALTDSKGNIWFATTNHGVQRLNKARNKFEKIALDSTAGNHGQWGQAYEIVELRNGNILVSDFGSGIKIYNEKLDLFQDYYLKANYSPKETVRIFEDFAGNIWFGGNRTLIKYSPSYYTMDEYNLTPLFEIPTINDYVTGIESDDDGFIWITIYAQGVYRLNPKTKEYRKFDISSKKSFMGQYVTWTSYRDKYGVIWIGTWYDGLIKFDPLREPFNYTKITHGDIVSSIANKVTAIAGSPRASEITLGTSARGLYTYNLQTKNAVHLDIHVNPETLQGGMIDIQGLVADDKSNKWFSYNNLGLFRLDKNNSLTSFASPHKGKATSYIANEIKTDPSGDIWIASRYGIEKFDPHKNEFTLLPTITNKQMSKAFKSKLNHIVETKKPLVSILKVGEASSLEKGLSIKQDQKVLIICVGEGRMNQGVDGLFDTGSLFTAKREVVWSMNNMLETFNIGGGFKNRIAVKCLDLKKGEYKLSFASDVGHSYGNWNVTAPEDSLWWGIQVFDISDSEFSDISSINEKEIQSAGYMPMEVGNAIEVSKKFYNVLWLGTFNNGFFKYDLSSGNFKQFNFDAKNKFSPTNNITSIFEDREGIVWIATKSNLLRFDPVTEKIDKFDQKDGLASNLINSIIEDPQGNLWISTTAGLSKLNKKAPREKWNFVNFDSKDGLQKYSTSQASWISENGQILLGAIDGLISFFPGKINIIKPDIVIEDIKISEVSIKSDSAAVTPDQSIYALKNLDLSYEQNNISFDFASIHFSRPAKNKVLYSLEGFTKHWIETDRNFASFTNLDPGEYIFRVKGSNGDGIWNETGREIKINIMPPWWQTTFAYILYLIAFIALIFIIDRIQRRRILTKERNAAAIKEANLRAQLAESENERKTKELEEARALQLSMLPKELPQLPNLDIAVYMQTATEVGGDYYDFHVGLDGTLTVVIGDATGHGMKAGTMVTTAKSLFRSYGPNPDILFSFQEITRCIKEMNFGKLSMCLTMLKIKGNKMQISTAGMPPSFIFRRDTRIVEEHMFKAMPLGTMEKFPYEIKDTTLKSGDTILMMSDGLPELANAHGEMYGYKKIRNGFEDVADKSSEEIVSYLKNEGASWVNNQDPDDDVTFVVIKVK